MFVGQALPEVYVHCQVMELRGGPRAATILGWIGTRTRSRAALSPPDHLASAIGSVSSDGRVASRQDIW